MLAPRYDVVCEHYEGFNNVMHKIVMVRHLTRTKQKRFQTILVRGLTIFSILAKVDTCRFE